MAVVNVVTAEGPTLSLLWMTLSQIQYACLRIGVTWRLAPGLVFRHRDRHGGITRSSDRTPTDFASHGFDRYRVNWHPDLVCNFRKLVFDAGTVCGQLVASTDRRDHSVGHCPTQTSRPHPFSLGWSRHLWHCHGSHGSHGSHEHRVSMPLSIASPWGSR